MMHSVYWTIQKKNNVWGEGRERERENKNDKTNVAKC